METEEELIHLPLKDIIKRIHQDDDEYAEKVRMINPFLVSIKRKIVVCKYVYVGIMGIRRDHFVVYDNKQLADSEIECLGMFGDSITSIKWKEIEVSNAMAEFLTQ